ncbi:hypothetical protein D3C76_729320 [compost metagenome]
MFSRETLGHFAEVVVATGQAAICPVIGINGLVHSLEDTIGTREQFLHLSAQLLVIQRCGELGAVELKRAVLLSVDTKLPQGCELITRTNLGKHLAQIAQQRAGGRVVGQGPQDQVVILVTTGRSQRRDGFLQCVVSVDKCLNRGFQAIIVRRYSNLGSGAFTQQLQAHATDRILELVGSTGNLQAIDGQFRILGQTRNVTGAVGVFRHRLTAVDLQLWYA